MHRLVMWGFALAFIPLSIAVAWEVVVVTRSFLGRYARKEPVSPAANREP